MVSEHNIHVAFWCSFVLMIIITDKDVTSTMQSCSVKLISSGKNDPEEYWEASVELNGVKEFYKSYSNNAARGIHIGILNITACQLVGEPERFDTYDSSSHNQVIADKIDAYPVDDNELAMVVVTGDNFARRVNSIGIDAFARLNVPASYLSGDRASFAAIGRPECEGTIADYRASAQGPVIITMEFTKLGSFSSLECGVRCLKYECLSFSQVSGLCTLFSNAGTTFNGTSTSFIRNKLPCEANMWFQRD